MPLKLEASPVAYEETVLELWRRRMSLRLIRVPVRVVESLIRSFPLPVALDPAIVAPSPKIEIPEVEKKIIGRPIKNTLLCPNCSIFIRSLPLPVALSATIMAPSPKVEIPEIERKLSGVQKKQHILLSQLQYLY